MCDRFAHIACGITQNDHDIVRRFDVFRHFFRLQISKCGNDHMGIFFFDRRCDLINKVKQQTGICAFPFLDGIAVVTVTPVAIIILGNIIDGREDGKLSGFEIFFILFDILSQF